MLYASEATGGSVFWAVFLFSWPYFCIPIAFAVDRILRARWLLEDVSRPASGYRFKGSNLQMVFTSKRAADGGGGDLDGTAREEGQRRSRRLDCTNLWPLTVVVPALFVCGAEWTSGPVSLLLVCTPFVFLVMMSLTLSQVIIFVSLLASPAVHVIFGVINRGPGNATVSFMLWSQTFVVFTAVSMAWTIRDVTTLRTMALTNRGLKITDEAKPGEIDVAEICIIQAAESLLSRQSGSSDDETQSLAALATTVREAALHRLPLDTPVLQTTPALRAWRQVIRHQGGVEGHIRETDRWGVLREKLMSMNAGMPFMVGIVQAVFLGLSRLENSNSFGSGSLGAGFYGSLVAYAVSLAFSTVLLVRMLTLINRASHGLASAAAETESAMDSFVQFRSWGVLKHGDIGCLTHIAARKGMARVLRFLVRNGANPNAIDSIGSTPLEAAKVAGMHEASDYLETFAGAQRLSISSPPRADRAGWTAGGGGAALGGKNEEIRSPRRPRRSKSIFGGERECSRRGSYDENRGESMRHWNHIRMFAETVVRWVINGERSAGKGHGKVAAEPLSAANSSLSAATTTLTVGIIDQAGAAGAQRSVVLDSPHSLVDTANTHGDVPSNVGKNAAPDDVASKPSRVPREGPDPLDGDGFRIRDEEGNVAPASASAAASSVSAESSGNDNVVLMTALKQASGFDNNAEEDLEALVTASTADRILPVLESRNASGSMSCPIEAEKAHCADGHAEQHAKHEDAHGTRAEDPTNEDGIAARVGNKNEEGEQQLRFAQLPRNGDPQPRSRLRVTSRSMHSEVTTQEPAANSVSETTPESAKSTEPGPPPPIVPLIKPIDSDTRGRDRTGLLNEATTTADGSSPSPRGLARRLSTSFLRRPTSASGSSPPASPGQGGRRGSCVASPTGKFSPTQSVLNIIWALRRLRTLGTTTERRAGFAYLRKISPFRIPDMYLLAFSDMVSLEEIPCRSGDRFLGHTSKRPITCTELAARAAETDGELVMVYVSHRWLEPDFKNPDNYAKARFYQVCYVVQMLAKRMARRSTDFYLWIDYASINQQDPAADRLVLPYVLDACDVMVYVEDGEYWDQALCRTEHYLFHCLRRLRKSLGPMVKREDVFSLSPDGSKLTLRSCNDTRARFSHNPAKGVLTTETDRLYLWTLVLALEYEMFYAGIEMPGNMSEADEMAEETGFMNVLRATIMMNNPNGAVAAAVDAARGALPIEGGGAGTGKANEGERRHSSRRDEGGVDLEVGVRGSGTDLESDSRRNHRVGDRTENVGVTRVSDVTDIEKM